METEGKERGGVHAQNSRERESEFEFKKLFIKSIFTFFSSIFIYLYSVLILIANSDLVLVLVF